MVLRPAHYVIKRRKILIIYMFLGCSQGNFSSASFSVYTFKNSLYKWTPLHSQNGGKRLMSEYWDQERRDLTLVIMGAWTL
jgi:hypothetical protein